MIEPGGTGGTSPLTKCLYSYDCTMTDPLPKVPRALEQGHGMYSPLPSFPFFLPFFSFSFHLHNTTSVAGLQGLARAFLFSPEEDASVFLLIWDCLGTERWESKVHRRGLKARLDRSSVSQMRGGAREHPDISSYRLGLYFLNFFFFHFNWR